MVARDLFEAISAQAWIVDGVHVPAEVTRIPTMLTPEEQRMLTWVAEHRAHPDAVVCDLGAFLGGSTTALAQGIRNSRIETTLHAFDRFTIDERLKAKFLYSNGYPPLVGRSMLRIVREHVAPFADFVELHPGEITDQRWKGFPISVLFIDISKSWRTNDFILTEFFPCLSPGAVIIQQDFFLAQNPWLHVTMQKLRHRIAYAGATQQNSAIFFVHETPTAGDVRACLRCNTPNREVFAAIDATLAEFKDDPVHLSVLRKLKYVYERAHDTMNAWEFKV